MEQLLTMPEWLRTSGSLGGSLGVPELEAAQQPQWEDRRSLWEARHALATSPALVRRGDVATLRDALRRVAGGHLQVLQAGDCAEDPQECTPDWIARKTDMLNALAGVMAHGSGKPVLRVGRIAGQFAKPRSRPTERIGGQHLPAFRGHLVNDPRPDLHWRKADPRRLVVGYHAAAAAMRHLGWRTDTADTGGSVVDLLSMVWTSHEALVLDYELPLLRGGGQDRPLLSSTHWPWIGDRTRQLDRAHVDLLARICNPVACKVGPTMTPDELLALCHRLDPHRDPGRLTLIARLGADAVAETLPRLVRAVRSAGHPVIWLVDPMHGNTVPGPAGLKTRFVASILREVETFLRVVAQTGGTSGGVHLESTPHAVTECVQDDTEIHRVPDAYTSLCDPRLNPEQALTVAQSWCR